MFKQVVLLKRRPDMSPEKFRDYFENYHSRLHERMGNVEPLLPNAQRCVRRYVIPEKNPVTGEIIDPGIDCIMEVWWNSRADFEASMAQLGSPDLLRHVMEDEEKFYATHSNPVFSVEECDSPVGNYN